MEIEDIQVTKPKEFEPKEITTGAELIEFLTRTQSSISLADKEADILLGYMEGHDYLLGEFEGMLYRGDLANERGEISWDEDEYSIDDVIDVVCEWNYELILEADAARNDPKDMIDFSNAQNKYETLKAEEIILDKLFDQTEQGKQIEQVARQMAKTFLENLDKDVGGAVTAVAEQVTSFSEKGRGR